MPTLTHVYDAAWSTLTISGTEIIDGLTQSGNIIVDLTGTNTSSYNFVAGVSNIVLGTNFVIVSDSTTAGVVGRTTGGNTTPNEPANTPTYWISGGNSPDAFLALVNALPPSTNVGFNVGETVTFARPYFDGASAGGFATDARIWLKTYGYWNNY